MVVVLEEKEEKKKKKKKNRRRRRKKNLLHMCCAATLRGGLLRHRPCSQPSGLKVSQAPNQGRQQQQAVGSSAGWLADRWWPCIACM
jgi:hypothetical protein